MNSRTFSLFRKLSAGLALLAVCSGCCNDLNCNDLNKAKTAQNINEGDGTTWTDLPTEGNATIRDDNWNDWYALYGPYHCRYLRFSLTLNPDHYYWNYASWGYAGIMGIGIRASE